MQHIKIFIELTRLNKPIGFMLLFWPCSWGLAYAYSINKNFELFVYYLILFFLGSVLMRSAGCIVNDIVDVNFDKKVKRTKNRPIASKKISIFYSLLYVVFLCFLAFLILIQFNLLTICLGIGSMIPAFLYPYMKRITYWPQLFLGFTFNWGIIMAWTASNGYLSYEIGTLYLSAIFWTLGYDTIYGVQDIYDDEIIGLKSTAIKFKKNIKEFITMTYMITILILIYLFRNNMGFNIFTLLFFMFSFTLCYQILNLKKNKPKVCLELFKFNNISGSILFLTLLSINL
ncbi:MAG: 4-hydroxybenzoate octaprenyltransferase [Candidatus Pelagibacter sp.]